METKRFGVAITTGLITIWTLFILFSFLFSTLIRFTNMTEDTFSFTYIFVSILILFIGGIITGLRGKQRGLLLGLLTGSIFICILFLIQFLGLNTGWHMSQLFYYGGFLLSCAIGSIIGVNLSSNWTIEIKKDNLPLERLSSTLITLLDELHYDQKLDENHLLI